MQGDILSQLLGNQQRAESARKINAMDREQLVERTAQALKELEALNWVSSTSRSQFFKQAEAFVKEKDGAFSEVDARKFLQAHQAFLELYDKRFAGTNKVDMVVDPSNSTLKISSEHDFAKDTKGLLAKMEQWPQDKILSELAVIIRVLRKLFCSNQENQVLKALKDAAAKEGYQVLQHPGGLVKILNSNGKELTSEQLSDLCGQVQDLSRLQGLNVSVNGVDTSARNNNKPLEVSATPGPDQEPALVVSASGDGSAPSGVPRSDSSASIASGLTSTSNPRLDDENPTPIKAVLESRGRDVVKSVQVDDRPTRGV